MDFVNTTPLTADLTISDVGEGIRQGTLVAKATYRGGEGRLELDRDEPLPIFFEDEATELGAIPRDTFPRRGREFEVMLFGAAYAPKGKPVPERTVSLRIGDTRRELLVSGDRVWLDKKTFSKAVPFERMELTYERAFGGRVEVEVDREAFIELIDPRNPAGRGFDAAPEVKGLADELRVPAGYPRWDETRRLPNVEDPAERIKVYQDAPLPASFSPYPPSSALQGTRGISVEPEDASFRYAIDSGTFFRARPEWVLPLPPREAPVVMEGMTQDERWAFALPPLAVMADYVVGDVRGVRPLAPHALVLLPEQRRFTVLYRLHFNLPHRVGEERAMRLRTEEGWLSIS